MEDINVNTKMFVFPLCFHGNTLRVEVCVNEFFECHHRSGENAVAYIIYEKNRKLHGILIKEYSTKTGNEMEWNIACSISVMLPLTTPQNTVNGNDS